MYRRRMASLAAGLMLAPAMRANAQPRDTAWPSRPIRIIVGFAAGGVADIMARLMAPKLSEALGQPVVVENRPGAGSIVAAAATAQAAPDGHTIMLSAETLAISPFVAPNLPYRPLADFAFITQCGYFDHVIVVGPNSPFQTIEDMVAADRARPGFLTVGGVGTPRVDKLRVQGPMSIEPVSFRTTPDLLAAVFNGTVDAGIDVIGPTLPLIQSGTVRPLVTTGRHRSSILPHLRSATEAGLGYVHTSFNGIIGPRHLPPVIVDRLNREFHAILRDPAVIERFVSLGVTAQFGTPAEFAEMMRAEVEVWKSVMPQQSPV